MSLLKICIVGSDDNLTHKFGNLTADNPWDTNYMSTLGHDIPTKRVKIEEQDIKLILMILSGGEFFSENRPKFYRGASAVIFLYDKGKKQSFNDINFFYNEFRKAISTINISILNFPISIVGIQTDKEVISNEIGQHLASKLNSRYYEIRIDDKETISQILLESAQMAFTLPSDYDSQNLSEWLERSITSGEKLWNKSEARFKLLFALENTNNEIRMLAFQVVKTIPIDIQIVPGYRWKVVKALEDESPEFRKMALEIIQKWPKKPKFHPGTQRKIIQLHSDEDHEVRKLAKRITNRS